MENKKPDLTSFKNIFNYVVYGLAGIVSVLWVRSNFKEDNLVENMQEQIDDCQDEKKTDRATIDKLLAKAYNLEIQNAKKDTMIEKSTEKFDSISAQNLKKQTDPLLNKIKKLTR